MAQESVCENCQIKENYHLSLNLFRPKAKKPQIGIHGPYNILAPTLHTLYNRIHSRWDCEKIGPRGSLKV